MTAKFLFCIPLRLGVILFALFQFLAAGAAAAFLWFVVWDLGNDPWNRIPKTLRAPLYIRAIISTFTSIVGFVGFIGSLCKKKALIRTFWVILCANLGIQIASSVYYLITFFRMRRASEKACLKFRPGTSYSDEWRYCDALDQLKRVNPVVIVIGAIVPLFVTGYAVYIAHRYVQHLASKNRRSLHLDDGAWVEGSHVPLTGPEQTEADEKPRYAEDGVGNKPAYGAPPAYTPDFNSKV